MRNSLLVAGRNAVRVGRTRFTRTPVWTGTRTERVELCQRGFTSFPSLRTSPTDPLPAAAPSTPSSTTSTSTNPTAKPTDALTPPLQTYNVTKADAKALPSTHHSLNFDGGYISIPWEEGITSRFHNFWLRDHCPCPSCRHPRTGQRTVDTWRIPVDVRAKEVEAVQAGDGEGGMRVVWEDGHESFFAWRWLHLHSYNPRLEKYFSPRFRMWGGKELMEGGMPTVEYAKVMAEGEEGVKEWSGKLYTWGICFVKGIPPTPEATEELIKRLAPIRHTHYGGFWDFTSDFSHGDLAYSTLALPAHTDTTYFTDPCGLQFFHLLSHEGTGGESLFVDGFKAANILRKEHPEEYKILSRLAISAHASGDEDISIRPTTPMPVLVHDNVTGELMQVRWNNEDRATMDRIKGDEVLDWYRAARVFERILRREENELWVKLEPGTMVGFDNWRVMHGRAAFEGKRRMCGAYVSRDDFYSRYLLTNAGRPAVLRAL